MTFQEIEYDEAKPFIERWHYSGMIPKGSHIFFGWFHENELYAVADYGNGVNPYQASFLERVTGNPVTNDNLVELKRLARSEPKLQGAYLTKFISKCHKALRRKGIRHVISFSDPAHGHDGGIYKAASFQHLGTTNAEWHLQDAEGNIHHRRLAYRYAKRNGVSTPQAREELGVTRVKTPPKDRWYKKL